jgi:hypothetical protein
LVDVFLCLLQQQESRIRLSHHSDLFIECIAVSERRLAEIFESSMQVELCCGQSSLNGGG